METKSGTLNSKMVCRYLSPTDCQSATSFAGSSRAHRKTLNGKKRKGGADGVRVGSAEAEEMRQHHVQALPTPYEYINKESSCTFYRSLFSDRRFVLVRFQVLLLYS